MSDPPILDIPDGGDEKRKRKGKKRIIEYTQSNPFPVRTNRIPKSITVLLSSYDRIEISNERDHPKYQTINRSIGFNQDKVLTR
jgi:hypothetical protein